MNNAGQLSAFPASLLIEDMLVGEGARQGLIGGKRRPTIPPELGYGASGLGKTILPDATLVFEIELLAISE